MGWGVYAVEQKAKRANNSRLALCIKKSGYINYKTTLLMLFAQQVVYCLDRIKRGERNFYEYGVPIAHRTVPQARKFERFQVFSVLRFVGNKARCLIHVVQQS